MSSKRVALKINQLYIFDESKKVFRYSYYFQEKKEFMNQFNKHLVFHTTTLNVLTLNK